MAIISDPEAVGFVNSSLRPAADRVAQLYYSLKPVFDTWNADNLIAKLPSGSTDTVQEQPNDTRHVVTADNCVGCMQRIQAFIQDMEANNLAHLTAILLLAVNPGP